MGRERGRLGGRTEQAGQGAPKHQGALGAVEDLAARKPRRAAQQTRRRLAGQRSQCDGGGGQRAEMLFRVEDATLRREELTTRLDGIGRAATDMHGADRGIMGAASPFAHQPVAKIDILIIEEKALVEAA